MRFLSALILALGASAAVALATETCFLDKSEEAGMNQICWYSCPSGPAAITISSAKLCPLQIKKGD